MQPFGASSCSSFAASESFLPTPLKIMSLSYTTHPSSLQSSTNPLLTPSHSLKLSTPGSFSFLSLLLSLFLVTSVTRWIILCYLILLFWNDLFLLSYQPQPIKPSCNLDIDIIINCITSEISILSSPVIPFHIPCLGSLIPMAVGTMHKPVSGMYLCWGSFCRTLDLCAQLPYVSSWTSNSLSSLSWSLQALSASPVSSHPIH